MSAIQFLRRDIAKSRFITTKLLIEVFGFGGIADTEYLVLVEPNYLAKYLAETGIWSTTS
jgi:hypothetical protein